MATGLTTTLNFLEVLGVRNKIAVLVGDAGCSTQGLELRILAGWPDRRSLALPPAQDMTFVTSPCAMRLTECGKIKHVDAYSAPASSH